MWPVWMNVKENYFCPVDARANYWLMPLVWLTMLQYTLKIPSPWKCVNGSNQNSIIVYNASIAQSFVHFCFRCESRKLAHNITSTWLNIHYAHINVWVIFLRNRIESKTHYKYQVSQRNLNTCEKFNLGVDTSQHIFSVFKNLILFLSHVVFLFIADGKIFIHNAIKTMSSKTTTTKEKSIALQQ